MSIKVFLTRDRIAFMASLFLLAASASDLVYVRRLTVARDSRIVEGLSWEGAVGAGRTIVRPRKGYLVVEFGDYQCPPCRAQEARIAALLAHSRLPLRLAFRNLPLTEMHPYAQPLAVTAEVARGRGEFETVHHYLYAGPFSPDLEDAAVKRFGLDAARLTSKERRQAEKIVADDVASAKRLNVDATPSFLLARPDGKVERTSLPRLEAEFLPDTGHRSARASSG